MDNQLLQYIQTNKDESNCDHSKKTSTSINKYVEPKVYTVFLEHDVDTQEKFHEWYNNTYLC